MTEPVAPPCAASIRRGPVPCRGPASTRFSYTVRRPFRLRSLASGARSLQSLRSAPHPSYRHEPVENCCPHGVQQVRARARSALDPPLVHRSGGPGLQLGPVGAGGPGRHPQPHRRGGPTAGGGRGPGRDRLRPGPAPVRRRRGSRWGSSRAGSTPPGPWSRVNEPLSPDPEWIASSEDVVTLAMQCATHWDGLAHASYGAGPEGGRLYNGFPASVGHRGRGRQAGDPPDPVAGVPGAAARRGPGQGPARSSSPATRSPRRTSTPPARSAG